MNVAYEKEGKRKEKKAPLAKAQRKLSNAINQYINEGDKEGDK